MMTGSFDPSSARTQAPTGMAPAQTAAVDVWDLQLDQPHDVTSELTKTLDSDELARADSFKNSCDQKHFAVAHGMMRATLATYVGQTAASLRFDRNSFGKPELVDLRGAGKVEFNLSRRGGRALLAVTRDEAVGVDLESVRDDCDCLAIAEIFFTPSERAFLRETEPEHRSGVFLRCWTLKEAYVKAIGIGLSDGLNRFDVSPLLRDPDAAKPIRGSVGQQGPLFGHMLDVGPSHVASLVIRCAEPLIRLRTFSATGIKKEWRGL